ncbi:hypothetical protein D3C81_2249280 [compost metagenome]
MAERCGNAMLAQPGDGFQGAFPFRGEGHLADQAGVLLFPGFEPGDISRHNMLRILRP